ncbi:MAG TPA: hypothetical protein VK549_10215 [Acidimicrobiia bacterium]|nr:hypothetical protein [Acidimicrobiia bacterium]
MARAQWRAEEEQWSRAALEQWEHGRGLADIVRDCMHRGDTVTFAFASHAWSGRVVAVGHDIARLDTGDTLVDLRLAAAAAFVLRVREGNRVATHDHGTRTTFTARLREFDGTMVCIGTASGPLEGRLRIGLDQVRITGADQGVAYVPAGSIWWVRPLED